MAELVYNIEKTVAVLSTSAKGWTKKLNLISWNNRPAKYDIREWSPGHEKMSKGITLSNEELLALKDTLNDIL